MFICLQIIMWSKQHVETHRKKINKKIKKVNVCFFLLSELYFFIYYLNTPKTYLHHTKQLIFTQYKSIYASNATAVSDQTQQIQTLILNIDELTKKATPARKPLILSGYWCVNGSHMSHHIIGNVMSRALENGSNVSKSGICVSCPLAIFSSLIFMVSSSLSILVLQQRGISPAQIINCYGWNNY